MKKAVTLALILALLFSAVAGTQTVKKARAETITVPDDYVTIQDAINAAAEGDTIFVKKGTYEEHSLVINKTITLIGEGASNSTITNIDKTPAWNRDLYPIYPPSPPVAIQVNASNVKVSGFTINGIDSSYEPLRLLADGAQIEDNIIEYSNTLRVSSDNNTITGNSLSNIKLIGAYNKILHNTLTGNASIDGAIYIKGSYNIVFSNTINDVAVYGFYSGINIEGDNNIVAKNNLTRSSAIEIETGSNNIILGNKLLNSGGVYITAGSGNVLFANRIENAGIGTVVGGYSDGALNSTLYHNNFINNTEQVLTSYGGGSLTYFDNGREGNYWSDYAGEDADGDGIGDTPYIIHYRTSTRRDNYPLMAPFDISTVTMEVPDWAFSVLSSLQSPSPSPSLEPDSKSEPLVTALIVALVITITVEGIGLLIYFKKRKH